MIVSFDELRNRIAVEVEREFYSACFQLLAHFFFFFLANPSQSSHALTVLIIFHEFIFFLMRIKKRKKRRVFSAIHCAAMLVRMFIISLLSVASQLLNVVFEFMTQKSIIASYNLLEFNFGHFWKHSKHSKKERGKKHSFWCLPVGVFFFFLIFRGSKVHSRAFFSSSRGKDCLLWIGCLLNRF